MHGWPCENILHIEFIRQGISYVYAYFFDFDVYDPLSVVPRNLQTLVVSIKFEG